MPRPKEDKKPAVMAAISEHLNLNGPQSWDEVMGRFPDVSRATFFRWVKEAKDAIESQASSHGTTALRLAQQRIRSSIETTPERIEKKIKAQLPVAPSPAVIADLPVEVVAQSFDFLAYFNRMAERIEIVAQSAEGWTEDGKKKAKNPMMLLNAAKAQANVLMTWMQSQQMFWDYQRMTEQNRKVLELLKKFTSDEQRQEFLVELRELNSKYGFNVNANIR